MNLDKFREELLRDSCEYLNLHDEIKELISRVSRNDTNVSYEIILLSKMLLLSEKLCNQIKRRNEQRTTPEDK